MVFVLGRCCLNTLLFDLNGFVLFEVMPRLKRFLCVLTKGLSLIRDNLRKFLAVGRFTRKCERGIFDGGFNSPPSLPLTVNVWLGERPALRPSMTLKSTKTLFELPEGLSWALARFAKLKTTRIANTAFKIIWRDIISFPSSNGP
jgi:hypothetical protein